MRPAETAGSAMLERENRRGDDLEARWKRLEQEAHFIPDCRHW